MKLLTETLIDEAELVVEKATDAEKSMHLSGIFMQAGLKNKNGRMYNADSLDEEIKRYIDSHVKTKRALGELCHPPTPTINPDRCCHRIIEMKREGNNFVGKSKILNCEEFPQAKIVRGLINEGVRIGVSSRGMGSLKENNGLMEVQPDYKLITVDVVMDPSAPDAWVDGVMENVEWIYDENIHGWRFLQQIEETKKYIRRLTRRQIEEEKLRLFEEMLADIHTKVT